MGVKYSQLPIGTDVADSDYLAFLDVSASELKRCEVSKIGGGKEITQAEYDLLPESEKVKGTWYITDGEGGGGGGGGTTVVSVTQAEYLANKAYYDALDDFIDIVDGDPAIITATEVSFDNTGTGMVATTTQAAITELNSNLSHVIENQWDTQYNIPTTCNSFANAYEFPTHGVILCIANNVSNAYLDAQLSNGDGTNSRELAVANVVNGKYQMMTVPVFKGMKVFYTNLNNGGFITFMPYVY